MSESLHTKWTLAKIPLRVPILVDFLVFLQIPFAGNFFTAHVTHVLHRGVVFGVQMTPIFGSGDETLATVLTMHGKLQRMTFRVNDVVDFRVERSATLSAHKPGNVIV